MSKYVPDISSRRWVIIAEGRNDRPDETDEQEYTQASKKVCPFCAGNEHLTPPELYRVGEGFADSSGWQVRVVPNKFPITDFHEIIIHAPDPEKDLHELDEKHLVAVFQTYRQRYNEHKENGNVIIFCNRGEHAGASIRHPHSQLVVIPKQINLDSLKREPLANVVEESAAFHVYCPDFSQWPYEVWIAPKEDGTVFGDCTDEQIADLSQLYAQMMKRLEEVYQRKNRTGTEFSYNFYIHPKENWFMRIIPRMVYRAGFELGTGLSVNVADPDEAARELHPKEEEIARLKQKLEELGV